MSDIAIRVENLGKLYHIGGPQPRYKTIRESIVDGFKAPFRRAGRLLSGQAHGAAELDQTIWALKDVSFEVKQGEVVGIIGRNGAGKSTLLKILTRITEPTLGEAWTFGRVGSLLEVGTGFHPELTGRENVYLNGAILGMKRTDIDRRFDEIIDFAGIEKFIDTPVKHYSSGMYVRLAFSVAAHLEPEILLIDEVLAVGDVSFQKKCMGKMGDVANSGRTVLFVSHNMAAIENLCNEGIVLHEGRIYYIGSQQNAISKYLGSFESDQVFSHRTDNPDLTKSLRITNIKLSDNNGKVVDSLRSGQDIKVNLHYEANLNRLNGFVHVGIMVSTQSGSRLFTLSSRWLDMVYKDIPSKGKFICNIKRLPLPPNTYWLGFAVKIDNTYVDLMIEALQLTVESGDYYGTGKLPTSSSGIVLIDGYWEPLVNEVDDFHD